MATPSSGKISLGKSAPVTELPQESAPAPEAPPPPPTAVDPTGPPISVQTSEALFDVAVALNACGYDYELEQSDPVRKAVRSDVDNALAASAPARDARDSMCEYIREHRLSDPGRDLAQYISLALYLTPPPALDPGTDETEMPPDSTQVMGILPQLRRFATSIQLHEIWVKHQPDYEEIENLVHDPLTKTIMETNIYLKQPTNSYNDRRFLVLLEPMLAPGQTNARIYGGDYIVVSSPVRKAAPAAGSTTVPASPGKAHDGDSISINMDQIRHTFLHYEIEPLVYAKATSMAPLLPLLKTVRDAPLDFTYRSDIVALMTECLIRAIEARTLDIQAVTGKTPPVKPGAVKQRAELEQYSQDYSNYLKQAEAARRALVERDMRQGYILTEYFYQQMQQLERNPVSLKEYMGEMIFGMDISKQGKIAETIDFYPEGSSDVVRRAPRQLHGLDLAEMDLIKGDVAGAKALAQKTLDAKTGDLARANFLLARIASMQGDMQEAAANYQQTIKLSHDLRTLAWSHIYLGRIDDIQNKRTEALAEYKAALAVRDGQPDTRKAAERGLKEQFQTQRQLKAEAQENTAPPETTSPTSTPAAPVVTDPTAPVNMVPDDNTPLPPPLPPATPKKK
ncbi:MAG: tetratricopeptide repeat protein [Acidobacteriaceae bacterium]